MSSSLMSPSALMLSRGPERKRPAVLIGTHDLTFGIKLADWLAAHGYQAVLIRSWATILDECREVRPQAILIDLTCATQAASPCIEDVLRVIEAASPQAVVIVMGEPIKGESARVRKEFFLRYIQVRPADFAHIGRLIRSELQDTMTPPTSPVIESASHTSHTSIAHEWDASPSGHLPLTANTAIGAPPTCHRCHGLMHPIDPLDPLDALRTGERDSMQAWRCISCGNLIDPVIIRNRHYARTSRSRRRGTSPRQPVYKGATS
ncbi:MAG: cobalamin B12-binding domain-containing protein [Nitrospira sp.]|nr:cobalamin B12-binding domain-containing protein [Nitrospira sp.]